MSMGTGAFQRGSSAGRVQVPIPRRAALLVGMLVTFVALLVSASSAWAGVGMSIVPTVPANVTIGQTGVTSTLVIQNTSTNGPGEAGYDTDTVRIDTITNTPSCGSPAAGPDCVGFEDPRVDLALTHDGPRTFRPWHRP